MRQPKKGIGLGIGSALTACVAAFALMAVMTAGSAYAGVGTKCPGTFRVLNNDTIDKVSFRKGNYTITAKRITCQQASDYFKQFLAANQNKLPKGWSLDANRLKFKNKKQNIAFRVKRVSGGGGGGGGGSTTGKCPGTFQVLHDDKIDKLSVPAGAYQIKVKRMSCQSASSYFKQFLKADQNKLPKGWKLIKSKQKFKNKKSGGAFRIKRVGS